jgi:hypothetical protein
VEGSSERILDPPGSGSPPAISRRVSRFRAKPRQVSSAQAIRKPTTKTAVPARAATTYSEETRLGRRTRLHSSSAMGSSRQTLLARRQGRGAGHGQRACGNARRPSPWEAASPAQTQW